MTAHAIHLVCVWQYNSDFGQRERTPIAAFASASDAASRLSDMGLALQDDETWEAPDPSPDYQGWREPRDYWTIEELPLNPESLK